MGKYRVASLQWIDVYANTVDEAKRLANETYLSEDDKEVFPTLVVAWDNDGVVPADEAFAIIADCEWDVWCPSNDPF